MQTLRAMRLASVIAKQVVVADDIIKTSQSSPPLALIKFSAIDVAVAPLSLALQGPQKRPQMRFLAAP